MGKTSTLKYLPSRIGAQVVPLFINIQGIVVAETLAGFVRGLAKAMKKSAKEARKLDFPVLETEELEKEPFLTLQDWMEEIEVQFPQKRFLLCFDEYERLDEIIEKTQSQSVLNWIRDTAQHREAWHCLFSGTHDIEELPPYWSDTLIEAHQLSVSYLQEEETRELILQPVPDFPQDVYNLEAVQSIIEQTQGHPYLTQLLCSVVIEKMNDKIRKDPTQKRKLQAMDVEDSLDLALERGKPYFNELWTDSLRAEDREAL